MDFTVSADNRVKLKERGKNDKYLDFAREVKTLLNMKVMVIPIVIGALGTISKELVKGLGDLEIRRQMEMIQTSAIIKISQNT